MSLVNQLIEQFSTGQNPYEFGAHQPKSLVAVHSNPVGQVSNVVDGTECNVVLILIDEYEIAGSIDLDFSFSLNTPYHLVVASIQGFDATFTINGQMINTSTIKAGKPEVFQLTKILNFVSFTQADNIVVPHSNSDDINFEVSSLSLGG